MRTWRPVPERLRGTACRKCSPASRVTKSAVLYDPAEDLAVCYEHACAMADWEPVVREPLP
jgi:hypothetical protein